MSKFRKETNALLRSLQNGDIRRWRDFYDFTYNHLKVMAFKYVYNKSEWKDVVQQTYLRIFQSIKSFDKRKDGYNWICKIAHNVALDFNNNTPTTIDINSVVETYFADIDKFVPDPNGLLHELSQLNLDDQYLVWLRYWEECTFRQIAQLTNTKRSTVYFKINEILKKLKEKLE